MKKLVTMNESRKLVGEDHPRTKLTDAEVEAIRELHEVHKMTYTELKVKFECSYSTIEKICTYLRRAQTVVMESGARTYRQKRRIK